MSNPHIHILMATYNAEPYLKEQLDSIVGQSYPHWSLLASDDGSTDGTIPILETYQAHIHQGPKKGFAANFMSLIEKAPPTSDYYAFSDQDDVWEADKLERAVHILNAFPADKPALYCSRTRLVDENLSPIGHSPLYLKKPSFKNALVQSIGGGNTMVFNRAALQLLRQTSNHKDIVSHDWWAYLLISAAGGTIYYDANPSLNYRQHALNLVGSNAKLSAKLYRVKMLFKGQLKGWINLNNKSLQAVSHLLTSENKQILNEFEKLRQQSPAIRPVKLMKMGLYRQTLIGQVGLMLGTFFNKI